MQKTGLYCFALGKPPLRTGWRSTMEVWACVCVRVYVSVWKREGIRTGMWPPQKTDWKQTWFFFFFFFFVGESSTWFNPCSPTQMHRACSGPRLFAFQISESATFLYMHSIYSVWRVGNTLMHSGGRAQRYDRSTENTFSPPTCPFPFVSLTASARLRV